MEKQQGIGLCRMVYVKFENLKTKIAAVNRLNRPQGGQRVKRLLPKIYANVWKIWHECLKILEGSQLEKFAMRRGLIKMIKHTLIASPLSRFTISGILFFYILNWITSLRRLFKYFWKTSRIDESDKISCRILGSYRNFCIQFVSLFICSFELLTDLIKIIW